MDKDFMELISTRHSIRDYCSDPIPNAALDKILEAGRLAPSAQNRQPWRYIVIRESNEVKAFVKHTGLIGLSNFFVKSAPCVIIACAESKKNLRINNQDYYLVDIAISFQQMMLCAWEMGIGSCWMAAFSEKALAKYLNIPKSWRIVAFSPFGYPKDDKSLYSKAITGVARSKKRQAIEDMVTFFSSR